MLNINFWMTCFSMVAVVIVVTFCLTVPQRWLPQEEESLQITEEQSITEEYDYLLKAHEGKLAVYFYGANKPQEVFEVYINTLPEYDQNELLRGLPVKDYEELLIRLEDYSS